MNKLTKLSLTACLLLVGSSSQSTIAQTTQATKADSSVIERGKYIVENVAMKERAGEIARRVKGVRGVVNNLKVQSG